MARRLSAAHKKAISMALRRVKGATTGLDEYKPKPKKPKAPAKPTRASASSGKKTAVKKTAGKKPAPAKTAAKKPATKRPAAKAPARKNPLPAPDNSPMPKKKTAATNRPTPKAETPAQARKADAEFKANREAKRDSTPFASIRNSMAEAQLINGRKSDRDRDEDLAEAIQRDSKLTGAEATAKRNAGTAAQLNAAKRRKAALREKEQSQTNALFGQTEDLTAALDDLVARPDMSAERRSMAAVDLANDAARLADEAAASPGTAAKARSLADRASELAMRMAESAATSEVTGERAAAVLAAARKAGGAGRSGGSRKAQVQELGARARAARERAVMGGGAVRPSTRAEQDEISRKSGSAETQQFTGTPGTWVGRAEAPNMARAGDTVHGTGKSKFFKGEMKIVGDPYVEDDGHAYVEVSKRNGSIELARADMEGNVLDDEGNVVASSTKPKRKDSGTLIPNARELPRSNKPAPLQPGPVPKDRMENMARAGDKIKGNGTDDEFFKGTLNVASDPWLESDGNIYVEIQRGDHGLEAVRTDADGNIYDHEDNLVATRVTEGGTKIKRSSSSSSSSREKAAKKRVDDLVKQNVPESDKRLAKARTELRRLREAGNAPDPRVSGFNTDGLW